MHTNIFERISHYKDYITSRKPLKIRTGCDQLFNDIVSIAIIPMTFKDAPNNFHTVDALFLIVSVISNEVFLGNDILMRSRLFTDINKHTIAFNNFYNKSTIHNTGDTCIS